MSTSRPLDHRDLVERYVEAYVSGDVSWLSEIIDAEHQDCPGTGQRVEFAAADFARVRGGKFVELWSVQDTAALLLGIGMKLQ